MTHTEIRDAAARDLPAIAGLHAASWKVAYRGILPQDFLDKAVEEDRARRWSGILERMGPRDRLLIAIADGRAVGFISGWTPGTLECDPGFDLHINNLHVRPDLRGQGLGPALMRTLADRHIAQERLRAYLWVVDGNEPAYRFYLKLGGRDGGRREVDLGGARVGETRIVWDDFRSFHHPSP